MLQLVFDAAITRDAQKKKGEAPKGEVFFDVGISNDDGRENKLPVCAGVLPAFLRGGTRPIQTFRIKYSG